MTFVTQPTPTASSSTVKMKPPMEFLSNHGLFKTSRSVDPLPVLEEWALGYQRMTSG